MATVMQVPLKLMARTQKDYNCTMINLKKMKINCCLFRWLGVWSVVQEVRHDVGAFKVVGWGRSKILDYI